MIGFTIYFVNNLNQFRPILEINLVYVLIIIIINILSLLTNSLMYMVFFRIFDKKVGLGECFDFTIKTSIANLLVPFKGGAFARAIYFKEKYQLSYSKFSAILGSSYLIAIAVLSVLGLFSLIIIKPTFSIEIIVLTAFFLALEVMSLVVIFFKINIKFENLKFIPSFFKKPLVIFDQLISAWNQISKEYRNVGLITILTTLNVLLIILITKIEFVALGIDIQFVYLVLYSVLSTFAVIFAFTPSALGIREAVLYIFSTTILISSQDILNIAVIDRAILFLFLLLVFVITKTSEKFAKNVN